MDTDYRKSLFFQKSACSQSLTPNPFPVAKGCVCLVGSASCRAFGHTRPASVPGLSVGLPPLVQARMLVVSHTKPLHDAVAQMADDLYGGFAPVTPFSKKYRFFDRLSRRAICTAAFCVLFGYGYRISVFYLAHNCVLIARQHSYAASV